MAGHWATRFRYDDGTRTNQQLLDRIARLRPDQRALLGRRLDASRTRLAETPNRIPQAGPRAGEGSLTHTQRRVWAFEQLCPGTPAYNVVWIKRLRGEVRAEALERAYELLIPRHEALLATFHSTPDGPVQRIPEAAGPHRLLRIAVDTGVSDRQEAATRIAREFGEAAFELSRGPLVRGALIAAGEREHWLILAAHHLVVDGWSLGVLERELAGLYNAAIDGRPPELAPPPVSYSGFAAFQHTQDRQAGLAYWRQELSGAPPLLGLRADFARVHPGSPQANAAAVPVSAGLQSQLEAVCRERGVTPYVLMVAAWAALLHRYGCGDEVMIGTPVAGRSRPELADIVGFFANTLPLRIALHGDPRFPELLARVQGKALGAIEHQDTPLDEALEQNQAPRIAGVSPGFQTAVAYLEAPGREPAWNGLDAAPLLLDLRFIPFDAMLYVDEVSRGLRVSVALRAHLFRPATADRLARHFLRLLEEIARDADRPVSRFALLDPAEREAVLALGAGPERTDPPKSVPELFEEQAAVHANRPALTDRHRTVSYAALREESNRIAAALARDGVGPGSIVAVRCDRSAGMVAAFLGVLKSGAAYLPLDPTDPADRTESLLRECGVRVTLDPAQLRGLPAEPPPAPATSAGSPAYIMFTSGSTGRPKPVVVPHRGIARLVKESGYASMGPDDVFLHMAPPAFDASTFEIWAPLLNGGHCVIHGEDRVALGEIGEAIRRHGITTLWLTSSLFNAAVDESPEVLAPLRQLLTGGEALSPRHVGEALDALPATRIINCYGPTECTTFACCYTIPRDWDRTQASVPIGRPIAETRAYILDSHREPVPAGVPGELYLGGEGVALGYWNQPEATAQAFFPDPFRPGAHRPLYRTGDRARWLSDGWLEFLGRTDDQVKLRGFRVEPGEVEAALRGLPETAQSAVAVQTDAVHGSRLVAYVVPAQGASLEDVRRSLAARLPEYMVPRQFVQIGMLPLTAAGKVDRRALPDPGAAAIRPGAGEPRDETERGLLAIWRELLGAPDAGVADDFFACGGDSLLAIRLLARVEKHFGRALPPATLFAAPSVDRLAKMLREPETDAGFTPIALGAKGSAALVWIEPGASLAPLAARLDRSRPFYSLSLTPSELAALPAPHRLIDMAAVLAAKIERQFGASGTPVVLASFCLRTFLAVETARLLRDRGRPVPLVVLVDPSDPDTAGRLMSPAAPATLLLRADVHLRELTTMRMREWIPYAGGRLRALAARVGQQFGSNEVASRPILAAGARHRLAPYEGALLLVRCAPPDRLAEDKTVRSWRRVACGELRVRSISGGHVEMFDEPVVTEFAQLLDREIAPVEAERLAATPRSETA